MEPLRLFPAVRFHGAVSSSEIKEKNWEELIIYPKVLRIPAGGAWIEVDSAFGGLAIYRRDAIIQGSYRHRDGAGRIACEHVGLHDDIRRRGGRIFINPSFINAKDTEHARHIFLSKFVRRQLRALGKLTKFMRRQIHNLRKAGDF